jgi:hypothetical protein
VARLKDVAQSGDTGRRVFFALVTVDPARLGDRPA